MLEWNNLASLFGVDITTGEGKYTWVYIIWQEVEEMFFHLFWTR